MQSVLRQQILTPHRRRRINVAVATQALRPHVSARAALQRLIDGNSRFVRGDRHTPPASPEILAKLSEGQQPYATILGCSDSRVPPELIFDAGLGDLFVARIAGNSLSPAIAGSLQYGGVHLRTPLLVVLGHEGCGAIEAALETKLRGARQPSRIQTLVDKLLPALSGVDPDADPRTQLVQAVEANVRWTIARLLKTQKGPARLAEGRIKIAGAVYQMATGRVRFLK